MQILLSFAQGLATSAGAAPGLHSAIVSAIPFALASVAVISVRGHISGDALALRAALGLTAATLGFTVLAAVPGHAGFARLAGGAMPAAAGLAAAQPCILAALMGEAHGATARETAAGLAAAATATAVLSASAVAGATDHIPGVPVVLWVCAGACAAAGVASASVAAWGTAGGRRGGPGEGRSAGLRRLLNDAEEKAAWDELGSMESVELRGAAPMWGFSGSRAAGYSLAGAQPRHGGVGVVASAQVSQDELDAVAAK
ncbi:hypothetical protein HK405_008541 [Cladochytrium tenue]|nr:hypothetical protein HK405_008541 [Cladochytrium tenue]